MNLSKQIFLIRDMNVYPVLKLQANTKHAFYIQPTTHRTWAPKNVLALPSTTFPLITSYIIHKSDNIVFCVTLKTFFVAYVDDSNLLTRISRILDQFFNQPFRCSYFLPQGLEIYLFRETFFILTTVYYISRIPQFSRFRVSYYVAWLLNLNYQNLYFPNTCRSFDLIFHNRGNHTNTFMWTHSTQRY